MKFSLMLVLLIVFVTPIFAQKKEIKFNGFLRDAQGKGITETSVNILTRTLTPNGCILREEEFKNISLVDGFFSLSLGEGVPTGLDKGFSQKQIFDNLTARNGLDCLSPSGALASGNYSPSDRDGRLINLLVTMPSADQTQMETLDVTFNLGLEAAGLSSEYLNGKSVDEFLQANQTKGVTQTSIESLLGQKSLLDSILAGTYPGLAAKATEFAAKPNGCSPDEYAKDIDARGNLTCAALPSSGGGGSISNAEVISALGFTPQGASTELDHLGGITGNGILQRLGPSGYLTLGTQAPITVTLTNNIGLNVGTGLSVVSNYLVPNFGIDAGTVTQGNDSRLPSSGCGSGKASRWTGSLWDCEVVPTPAPIGPQWSAGAAGTMNYTLGNVGIGITNPETPLQVSGNVRVDGTLEVHSGSIKAHPVEGTQILLNHGGSGWGYIGNLATGLWSLGYTDGGQITPDHPVFNWTNSGLVGIGTTNPAAKLEVVGEVKFGNTSSACNSTTEGQQRYNSTLHVMEFCNGTTWTSYSAGGSPAHPSVAIFTSNGSWTCPSGVTRAKVTVVGGGGSGNVALTAPYNTTGGGGGGAAIKWYTNLVVGTVYTVTVGSGGAAAIAAPIYANGNPGGQSTFSGSGIATITGDGGSGAAGTIANGGSASGGDLNIPGGDSSAIVTNSGNYPMGGASYLANAKSGAAATGYGGGGGGAGPTNTSYAGSAGVVIIEY